jgi:hypothetical protein
MAEPTLEPGRVGHDERPARQRLEREERGEQAARRDARLDGAGEAARAERSQRVEHAAEEQQQEALPLGVAVVVLGD